MHETRLRPLERTILRLLGEGMSASEIGRRIGKRPGTVRRIIVMIGYKKDLEKCTGAHSKHPDSSGKGHPKTQSKWGELRRNRRSARSQRRPYPQGRVLRHAQVLLVSRCESPHPLWVNKTPSLDLGNPVVDWLRIRVGASGPPDNGGRRSYVPEAMGLE